MTDLQAQRHENWRERFGPRRQNQLNPQVRRTLARTGFNAMEIIRKYSMNKLYIT